jgi:hypothetical protein
VLVITQEVVCQLWGACLYSGLRSVQCYGRIRVCYLGMWY